MTAVDAVSDPSAMLHDGSGAFVKGIMEGVEFTMTPDGNFIQQQIADIAKKEYDRKRLTEQRKMELFSQFIAEIRAQ